jgi:DNA-nicking Smr family endonuclease
MRKTERAEPALSQEDAQLLAQALAQVIPLRGRQRVTHDKVVPQVSPHRRRQAFEEPVSAALSDGDVSGQAEVIESFQRPGVASEALRRLRRESSRIRETLDLHGLNREQARLSVAHFVKSAASQGIKRVRIIHGQGFGSTHGGALLRQQTRHWLTQIDEVLGFAGAPAQDGGKGAVLVLLRSSQIGNHR